jgi:membrane protease YdiL (CAAX protease family)
MRMATMDAVSQDDQANQVTSGESSEVAVLPPQQSELPGPAPLPARVEPRGIAPLWHTVVLILGILAFSVWGSKSGTAGTINPFAPVHDAAHASANGTNFVRLIRYGLTGALELLVVAWVALGLRLRKRSFRSLFGAWPHGLNDITKEAGIAAAFWICSMIILVCVAVSWGVIQTKIYQHQTASQSANPSQSAPGSAPKKSPQQEQAEMARQLMELAPANSIEIAAWGLLCLVVGFSEELIFRGYLQTQSIAVLRNLPAGVVLTALIFGAAHGYQGLRGIVLISIYGALFGCITLLRKNLFPGMLAHSWHDFATGMLLAFLRSTHLLDHLPQSH